MEVSSNHFKKGAISLYIQYTMDQLYLPMDLEEDIPENHLVRVVNAAVNRLDDAIFDAAYPGGGRDSYHPKMLTKVIIYAYTQRIYSLSVWNDCGTRNRLGPSCKAKKDTLWLYAG